jgi:hypothetical protein
MKTKINFKQSIIAGLWAAITAVIINIILFLIFHAAGIITDSVFIKPGKPMDAIQIIIASVIPVLIASIVFFLIEKYTKNGFKIFTIVSIILLVLSFLDPFMAITGITTGYALALNLMHIVVVLALLYFIRKANKLNNAEI